MAKNYNPKSRDYKIINYDTPKLAKKEIIPPRQRGKRKNLDSDEQLTL